MKKWQCIVCGLIYNEADGWPDDGIAPGTRWEDVDESENEEKLEEEVKKEEQQEEEEEEEEIDYRESEDCLNIFQSHCNGPRTLETAAAVAAEVPVVLGVL